MKNIWTGQDLDNIEQFVEDGGTRVIVTDHLPPEASAMALAKYSRSSESFLIHLKEVVKSGWKQFLMKFYVNYGHASIGDCGSTTACLENVSMLNAVAYEDDHAGGWQERSTRYQKMATQRILNPLSTQTGEDIQERQRSLYMYLLEVLPQHIRILFPKTPDTKEDVYENTILSKACDIAGAFLPAGTTTSVGRHVDLRHLRDHLLVLRNYPLREVRETAEMLCQALSIQYPSSGFAKRYDETERYAQLCSKHTYLPATKWWSEFLGSNTLDIPALREFAEILSGRPEKAPLPQMLNNFGEIRYRHLIDDRSYRDEHRHCRSGAMYIPMLTTRFGFESWYLRRIPQEHLGHVLTALTEVTSLIEKLDCDDQTRQYYVPMGHRVAVLASWRLPAAVYIADLRSGQTVHPTVRVAAQKMGRYLQETLPDLKLYCDYRPDIWSTKRGEQTIIEKKD